MNWKFWKKMVPLKSVSNCLQDSLFSCPSKTSRKIFVSNKKSINEVRLFYAATQLKCIDLSIHSIRSPRKMWSCVWLSLIYDFALIFQLRILHIQLIDAECFLVNCQNLRWKMIIPFESNFSGQRYWYFSKFQWRWYTSHIVVLFVRDITILYLHDRRITLLSYPGLVRRTKGISLIGISQI